jgi:putative spermidine/putrescine transport system substrate-binding protein
MREPSRRWFLLAACLILAVGTGRESVGQPKPVTLVFMGSGGALQEAEVKAYVEPYKKLNPHVTIVFDSPVNYAKIKAMVESGNVTIDLVEGGPQFGVSAEHIKLLEKIDCTIVPCSRLQPEKYPQTGYRIAQNLSATAMGYRTDKFPAGKEPQGWADFFDLQRFPGKRALLKLPTSIGSQGILEAALLADGVEPAKLYPLDIPRALRKLDTIRSEIVFAADNQGCAEKLATGEAVMALCYNGRFYNFWKAGAPIAMQWNTAFQQSGYLTIPKGTKNLQEVMKFAAFMVSDEYAAGVTEYIPYGPANQVAAKKSSPATKDWNPALYQDRGIVLNDAWWSENLTEAVKQWTAWQVKGGS